MSYFTAKMHQIRLRLGLEVYSAPHAGFKGPTSKGKERTGGEGKIREERRGERKRGKKGTEERGGKGVPDLKVEKVATVGNWRRILFGIDMAKAVPLPLL